MMPIRFSFVTNANEPRLQNEIDLASARLRTADVIPTSDVKIAETAIPTMIKLNEDNAPRIVANLKVIDVASRAPAVPQASAPSEPT